MRSLLLQTLCVLPCVFLSCSPFGSSQADSEFHPQVPILAPASLSISDGETFDYGDITVGASENKTFTLSNFGQKPANSISVAALTSDFTIVEENCGSSLGGGASCEVIIKFNPSTDGTKTDELQVSSVEATATRPLRGNGLTVASLSISDGATYDYGNVAISNTATKIFTVTNSGQSSASSLSATTLSSPFSFPGGYPGGGTCGSSIGAGVSCTVVATVSPTTYGNLAETLTLTYNNGAATTSTARGIIANGVGQSGTIDSSFGGSSDGVLTTMIGTSDDVAYSVKIQSDGGFVVGGSVASSNSTFGLVRYLSTGELDTSFNSTGKVVVSIGTSNDVARAVQIQTDGNYILAGNANVVNNADFGLARVLPTGNLDTSFNTIGTVRTAIGTSHDLPNALLIQTDGRMVAVGYSHGTTGVEDFALVRYLSNGILDTTFNSTGRVRTTLGTNTDAAQSAQLQTDGAIVAAGYFISTAGNTLIALARYQSSGNLDTSFSTIGKVFTSLGTGPDIAYAIEIQTDGKLLVGGRSYNLPSNSDFAVLRYLSDGTLDTTFNGTGNVTTSLGTGHDVLHALQIQTDAKVFATGYWVGGPFNNQNNFAMARYLPSGPLDTSFNTTGFLKTTFSTQNSGGNSGAIARSVALQTNGTMLVAGNTKIAVAGRIVDFMILRVWP